MTQDEVRLKKPGHVNDDCQITDDDASMADCDWTPPPMKTTWLDTLDQDMFHSPINKYTASLCVDRFLYHGEGCRASVSESVLRSARTGIGRS